LVFVEYAFDVLGLDREHAYSMVLEWLRLIGARVGVHTKSEVRAEHGSGSLLYTNMKSFKTIYVKLSQTVSGESVSGRIEVHFGSRASPMAEGGLRRGWGDPLISRLKVLIEKYKDLTKKARKRVKQLERRVVEEKPKLDEVEEKVLDLLVAYDRADSFALKKLSEMTGEKIKRVRLAVARLLRVGMLSGYLEGDKYRRGVQYVTTCLLCNERHYNPGVYYQCPECFQYVCESCMSVLPSNNCPRHPEAAVEVVMMPLHCISCKVTVSNLEKNRSSSNCPNCEQVMAHIAERFV
jgi:hypothetical protein